MVTEGDRSGGNEASAHRTAQVNAVPDQNSGNNASPGSPARNGRQTSSCEGNAQHDRARR